LHLNREGRFYDLRDLVRAAYLRFWVLPRIHRTYRPLSVAETFQRIYRTKSWGDNGEAFCSGSGSSGEAAELHTAFVIKFIQDRQLKSVTDLGCGDFSVGRRIVEATGVRYTGIDVVPELIEHHKRTAGNGGISFACLDITTDPLPTADLCLIRQVLQHLSNREIAQVIANLNGFPLTLISEDVPTHPKSFNRDKAHGPDIRSYYGSGVYVDMPPFSKPIAGLWDFPLTSNSVLRTALLSHADSK
jgi:SAM-dependent methyltransferase